MELSAAKKYKLQESLSLESRNWIIVMGVSFSFFLKQRRSFNKCLIRQTRFHDNFRPSALDVSGIMFIKSIFNG